MRSLQLSPVLGFEPRVCRRLRWLMFAFLVVVIVVVVVLMVVVLLLLVLLVLLLCCCGAVLLCWCAGVRVLLLLL